MSDEKEEKIKKLRAERDVLWKKWNGLQKKNSFSGISVSGDLNRVQQELDELDDDSERYFTEINMLG